MASSSGDPRAGLLLTLRSLLRATGIPREQIAEDMPDYERLSLADLEATIYRLQEILRPVRPDEGSSRHPHAGRDTGGAHRYRSHLTQRIKCVVYYIAFLLVSNCNSLLLPGLLFQILHSRVMVVRHRLTPRHGKKTYFFVLN